MINTKFAVSMAAIALILSACGEYPTDDKYSVCDQRGWSCDETIPTTTTTRYATPTQTTICLKAYKPAKPKPTQKTAPIIIIPLPMTTSVVVTPTTTTTQTPVRTTETTTVQQRPGC